MDDRQLVEAARAAAEAAYAPYSGFRVGAAVLGSGGEVFTGANVENAAYPSGSCAEATAINTAVAQGVRAIDTVVNACVDADDVDGAYPCGRCRQIMSEFDVRRVIVTAGEGSEVRVHTLDELLPYRFRL
ncbi:MAG TPA: cytidine deaminase [Acidimicrobiia bacterium]|jgi:cytidine deaminase|nr:cytidine deaminase [Acidimicrobiia bacterium]